MKTCNRCGEDRPLEQFYRNRGMRDGRINQCKACVSEASSRRYQADPEKKISAVRAYREANRDEVLARKADYNRRNAARFAQYWRDRRIANPELYADYSRRRRALRRDCTVAPVTASALAQKLDAYGHLCAYCGIRLSGDFHWDHWKPLSKGGPHMLANLFPSCPGCNLSKSVKWPFPAPRNFTKGA